jgi:hypothetical protein
VEYRAHRAVPDPLIPVGNCGYDASALVVDGVGVLAFLALVATASAAALAHRRRARALARAAARVAPGPAVLTGALDRRDGELDVPAASANWVLRLADGRVVPLAPGASADVPLVHGARVTLVGRLVPAVVSPEGATPGEPSGYRGAPGALVLAPEPGAACLRTRTAPPWEADRALAAYHRHAGRVLLALALVTQDRKSVV